MLGVRNRGGNGGGGVGAGASTRVRIRTRTHGVVIVAAAHGSDRRHNHALLVVFCRCALLWAEPDEAHFAYVDAIRPGGDGDWGLKLDG